MRNGLYIYMVWFVSAKMPVRKIKDADSIFEEIVDVEDESFRRNLDDLVDVGYLTKEYDDDEDRIYFRAREGLSWSEVARLDCSVKKQILLQLIDNPKAFFVLYNTQKGKLRIATEEIRMWVSCPDSKIVGFLIVDNDKTLADQTAEGMIDIIEEVAQVFRLSSNSAKDTLDSIRTYTDAYAADKDGEYKMPVIVALNNTTQLKKILMLMAHIKHKVETRNSQLRYGCVFDEADKVYPQIRDKEIGIGNGTTTSLFKLLVEDDRAVHRLGWVSATEGELMDREYPECANAFMYPVPPGDPNYRAAHTEDAIIKHVPHRVKDSNDVYAESILAGNREHFMQKIRLKNGTEGFRKIIVNGGAKTATMEAFARKRIEDGSHCITVNMMGVVVYRHGHDKKRYSAKGIRFGQLLFNIYRELGLHDKPLFIIGRRKVDRGLGFHFAPRDGSDGLIWTDMILGRVDDKDHAVQKAGRLAGVVSQCPQYPGELFWWTDERTGNSIVRHNNIVDETNKKRGCSIVQAVERAKDSMPEVPVELRTAIDTYRIYTDEETVRDVCKILGYRYVRTECNLSGFKETSLNNKRGVVLLDEAIRKVRSAYGTNSGKLTFRVYYPCYADLTDNTTLHFVVIIRPDTDTQKLAVVDSKYVSVRM